MICLLRVRRCHAASQDWALADGLLQESMRVFGYALERAPSDTRALGNAGNVLLAQGELKQLYLASLQSGPPPATEQERTIQRCVCIVVSVVRAWQR